MSKKFQISCRAIFRGFTEDEAVDFMQKCRSKDPRVFFKRVLQVTSDKWDERQESIFTMNFPSFSKSEKYKIITEVLMEIQKLFEDVRNSIFHQYGLEGPVLSFQLKTKGIYPIKFSLVHFFEVKKVIFGSTNKRIFNSTFIQMPPATGYDFFGDFLEEYHDGRESEATMTASAQHDRRYIVVNFPNRFIKTNPITTVEKRIVELYINYSNIRKLAVTLEGFNDDGSLDVIFIFELEYPVTLKIRKMIKKEISEGKQTEFFSKPFRYLTWNPKLDVENSIAKGHSLQLELVVDSPRDFLDCIDRIQSHLGAPIEYRIYTRSPDCINVKFYEDPRRGFGSISKFDPEKKENELDYFPLRYAVEALLSLGGPFYDYFFRKKENLVFKKFLEKVIHQFESDVTSDTWNYKPHEDNLNRPTKTVLVLEEMLLELKRLIDIPDPFDLFNHIYNEQNNRIYELLEAESKEGYVRIRRIIKTPTRIIYTTPELIMGNKAVRSRRSGDEMLRIVFRDDDNRKLMNIGQYLIQKTVGDFLEAGIWDDEKRKIAKNKIYPLEIGGRRFSFLGYSNSQLRDHGCYFLRGTELDVQNFRKNSGKFKIEQISKMMSRFAQVFTQSRKSRVTVDYGSYDETYDILGGSDSNQKPYIFTDGVGDISVSFAREIMEDMGYGNCLPSCYQFRFRGYKGILTLNRELDEVSKWAKENNFETKMNEKKNPWYQCSMRFRKSQKKFKGPREKNIQIVKVSSPAETTLNKPLINILDQNSEKQKCSKKIKNTVFEALENHIQDLILPLVDELRAFGTVCFFPRWIHYEKMIQVFNFTEEPFLRSLLVTVARADFQNSLKKMKIKIPGSKGRLMFGICDKSNLLQSGQVFVQYTVDVRSKYPSENSETKIHKGKILITKNPSIVPGDVRIFEAVDIPALDEFKDCVVFPCHCPRPHPDEMAGSDLDGDEYSVYFDPGLFPEKNEKASDFTPENRKINFRNSEIEIMKNLTLKATEFFTNYIKQDSIGNIANAHLANSDLYGLEAPHCREIAKKQNMAVDFPKSGIPPEKLTKNWTDGIPPEVPERFPSFMRKEQRPGYRSKRLLGDLHLDVMTWSELAEYEAKISNETLPEIDPDLVVEGSEKYIRTATEDFKIYSTFVNSILEKYGLTSESELFSGSYISMKKRTNEDSDDICWAEKQKIKDVKMEELDLFIILFGLGKLDSKRGGWLEDSETTVEKTDLHFRIGGIGKIFFEIIEFMTTRKFGYPEFFTFTVSGDSLNWSRSQCLNLHLTSMNTFFPMAFSRRFSVLPGFLNEQLPKNSIEGSIFVLEVPNYDYCIDMLKIIASKSGLDRISTKKNQEGKFGKNKISILPVGTFASIQKFKRLLTVEPDLEEPNFEKRSRDLSDQLFKKIKFYSRDDTSIDQPFDPHLEDL